MNKFIESQNWRYATKKFDATKKVSTEDLEILKEAIRLSTSSYGLQPYKVFIIENKDRIAQMILTPVIKMNLEETDKLTENIRRESRFSSKVK